MAMQLTATQLSLRGRQGVYTRLANEDAREMTRPAQRGFMVRFDREVVAKHGVLEPAEHARRAHAALCAYMAGLRLKQSLAETPRPATAPAFKTVCSWCHR